MITKKLSPITLSFFAVCYFGLIETIGAQEENPLENKNHSVFKVKSKDEKMKDIEKLTGKGKAEFEKAKNDYKKLQNPKFEIAPNEIVNGELNQLIGVIEPTPAELKEATEEVENAKKNLDDVKLKSGKLNNKSSQQSFHLNAYADFASYASYSWKTSILTPVKDQKSCGSCSAFAACAAFEHTYANLYGTKLDLSEQDILSCGKTCDGANVVSCNGGSTPRAFSYMKCTGISSEAAYPYTALNSYCIPRTKYKSAKGYGMLYLGRFPTVSEIKNFVSAFGAVVTYMKAGLSTFYSYGSGVYNGYPSNSKNEIDHAVVIVGWSDYLNAWIIKNSWGTNWGSYGGYAYVGYNQCNIGKYVYWVNPNQ